MNRLRATFASLHNRSFRLFFTGQAISESGAWMQKIGQAWLVLELTDSGTLLGVTAALQHLPTLFVGPWGGLLADRLNKRRLLLVTQTISGLLALILAVLTHTGRVELWMVLVLALLLGTTQALDRPARKTFLSEMVGLELLTNAVMLNSVVMHSARVIGPAIAGIVIAAVGLAASFYINAASFLAVVSALLLIHTADLLPARPVRRKKGQLREGFRYVRDSPELLGPLILMTVAGMFAYEWAVTIPLLARDAFGGDATMFGSMFSAMGIGAVAGGLVVAGALRANISALLRVAWIFSALVIIVAIAPTLPTVLIALVLLGGVSITFKSLATALLQLKADPDKRGRVLALLSVAAGGTTPIGAPLVGWIAEAYGIRFAIGLGGVATILAAIGTAGFVRRHEERERPHLPQDPGTGEDPGTGGELAQHTQRS